jgi:hypothetical protein
MRRTKALLVLGLAASAISAASVSGSAAAKGGLPPAKGVEQIHSAMWPTVAAQLATNLAAASLAHKYSQVWGYLDPAYRKAVSQAHWQRCVAAHPAAPRTVTITKVSVARATELPVDLPIIGRRNVQEIEILVRFKSRSAPGPQLALLYTLWSKQGKTWTAVWLSDEYRTFKAGSCYLTPQGPPLY